jgi:hypothetical protein
MVDCVDRVALHRGIVAAHGGPRGEGVPVGAARARVHAVNIKWLDGPLTRALVTRADGKQAEVYLFCAGGNWYFAEAGRNASGPTVPRDIQSALEKARESADTFWKEPKASTETGNEVQQPLPVMVLKKRPWWRRILLWFEP